MEAEAHIEPRAGGADIDARSQIKNDTATATFLPTTHSRSNAHAHLLSRIEHRTLMRVVITPYRNMNAASSTLAVGIPVIPNAGVITLDLHF